MTRTFAFVGTLRSRRFVTHRQFQRDRDAFESANERSGTRGCRFEVNPLDGGQETLQEGGNFGSRGLVFDDGWRLMAALPAWRERFDEQDRSATMRFPP